MRARAAAIASIAVIGVFAAACGGGASAPQTSPASTGPSIAPAKPSSAPSAAALATGSGAVSKASIVGEWVGVIDCDQVVSLLKGAKLDDLAAASVVDAGLVPGIDTPAQLKDPTHPCVGASDQHFSHFFAADGSFGSKNGRALQVDTGTWTLQDGKVVINDQPFGFSVVGDQLTLTPPPVEASCKTVKCRTAAAWAIVVAMQGSTWTKGIITP